MQGEEHGFASIPRSMYRAVVTMTTVGYGDIVPRTILGRIPAAFVMILGYSIIAVPTGIVSVELAQASRPVSTQAGKACGRQGHDAEPPIARTARRRCDRQPGHLHRGGAPTVAGYSTIAIARTGLPSAPSSLRGSATNRQREAPI